VRPRKSRRSRLFASALTLLGIALSAAANAQANLPGAPPIYGGDPPPAAADGHAEEALPLGNWLVYPGAFVGAALDSNPDHTPSSRPALGLSLAANLAAENGDGVRRTTIYSASIGQFFPGRSEPDHTGDLVATRTGLLEKYDPAEDLRFTAQADFTRQQDVFGNFGVGRNISNLNPAGTGLAPTANPVSYNQFAGTATAQKKFVPAFLIVAGSIVGQRYDEGATISPSGTVYTGIAKAGYWLTPDAYSFLQASLDRRDYGRPLGSSGYRVVVGLGAGGKGLLQGEVYAGYQEERPDTAAIGTGAGAVFGGRGSYRPLPELALDATVDRAIGAVFGNPAPAANAATATETTTFLAQADYRIAPEWTAVTSAGYIFTRYERSSRRDGAWTLGIGATYSVWRSLGLTLNYQHIEVDSNVRQQSFADDAMTVGLSYKY